jgi:hypothetical protein
MPVMIKQYQFWALGVAVISLCLFAFTWMPAARNTVVFPLDTSHAGNNQLTINYPLAVREGEKISVIVKITMSAIDSNTVVRARWDLRNAAVLPPGEVYAPIASGNTTLTWQMTPGKGADGTFWLSLIKDNQEEPILARQFTFPIQTYFSLSAQTLRILSAISMSLSLIALAFLRRQI